MSPPLLEDLITLDRLVHEPARFAILTALTACQRADFQSLQAITGLAQGNLSGHLQKLEAGGLITIDKQFNGKYPHTWLEVTPDGRAAFEEHWKRLDTSVTRVRGWRALAGMAIQMDDPSGTVRRASASPSASAADSFRDVQRLADAAERLIDAALARHAGNRRRAAEELGISLATLKRKLRRRRGQTQTGGRGV